MFRFANVEGRCALVDPAGYWFDASRVSRGSFTQRIRCFFQASDMGAL